MPSKTPLPGTVWVRDASNRPLYYSLKEFASFTGFSIQDIPDVVITNLMDGQVITYDSVARKWVNGAGSVGGVTSVDITPGTGISASGGPITSAGSITVTNTAPDQTVVLTDGTGISVTGTYPNFTITNTAPSSIPSLNSVLGVGNTSTTSVVIVSGSASSTVSTGGMAVTNGSTTTSITANQLLYHQAIYQGALMADTLHSNQVWTLPNNTGTVALTSDIPTVTPATLSKTDDTNVILTLSGTPSTALLQSVGLTLGWTGTLADGRIASSSNWNTAYTNRITSLTTTGTSGVATLLSNTLNVPNYTLAGLGGQPLATNLTSLSGLSYSSLAFVKMSASGTFSLDTTTYLSSFTGMVETINFEDSGSNIVAQTFTLDLYANYGYTINALNIISGSGTCTANLKINSTSVTSLSSISVSSTISSTNATGANTVIVGDKVTLVITSPSSLTNLQVGIKITRT